MYIYDFDLLNMTAQTLCLYGVTVMIQFIVFIKKLFYQNYLYTDYMFTTYTSYVATLYL